MKDLSPKKSLSILPLLLKDGSYQASGLVFFSKVWLATWLPMLITLIAFQSELRARWLAAAVTAAVIGVVPLFLKHLGYLRLALIALPLLSWLGITVFASTAGGLMASCILTFIPIIPITSLLAGKRWGAVMLVLCVGSLLIFALLETYNLLPQNVVNQPPLMRWVYLLVPFGITWGLHYYTSKQIHPAFDKVFTETGERKKVEQEKDLAYKELNERMKELQTLYDVGQILQDDQGPVPELLKELVGILPLGWQYSETTAARLVVGNQEYLTANFRPSPTLQEAVGTTAYGQTVSIQVIYLESRPDIHEGPFLAEERRLINMLGKMLVTYLDKRYMLDALRQSEANLNTIFNTTNIAYTLIDERLHILSQNTAAQEFGKKEFGMVARPGDPLSKYIPEDRREELGTMMENVLRGQPIRYEAKYPQADGSINWYSVGFFPIIKDNDSVWGFMLEIEDVTKTKNAELALTGLNESLEQKVAERTQELMELNKELETFSYTVSHDLKSPIRAISGYSSIMLRKHQGQADEELVEFMKSINEAALQMNDLIDGLLKFSLLGRSQLSVDTVDMDALVNDVLKEVEQTYAQISFTVSLAQLPVAKGDAKLIRQVWANLAGNAVKYSGKKSQPHIEIGSREENGEVVYFVKDNGDGFDMKYAGKLFQIFNRLHTNSEFEGTGIGLATVHRIITKHGGRIWAEATKGEGAAFYFTLGL